MLSPSQDWAVRGLGANNGILTASRLGEWMTKRPGLDTTGKTYSPYTLGRMGGGIIMHLKKSGMVRSRKIRGITVACLTRAGRRYLKEDVEALPDDLSLFLETFV